MMWLFPLMSGILIVISFLLSTRHKKKREGWLPKLFLALNRVGLLSLVIFLTFFLRNERIVTDIHAAAYWILIAFGVLIGIFSFVVKYVPGHLTAAAVLLFCGFVTIFSIGFILIALAVIEILVAVFQYKMWNRKLNE